MKNNKYYLMRICGKLVSRGLVSGGAGERFTPVAAAAHAGQANATE